MIQSITGLASHPHQNWKTIVVTATLTLLATWTFSRLKNTSSNDLKKNAIRVLMTLPRAREKIDAQLDSEMKKLEASVFAHRSPHHEQLPEEGVQPQQILSTLGQMKNESASDADLTKVSGGIYTKDPNLLSLFVDAFRMIQLTNPLHSDLFTWVNQCEAEVVSMCAGMMHGGVGTLTSGGTSSITHAIKAYHKIAKEKGIIQPNIVIPCSAHASFWKAAEELLFPIEVRVADIDETTGKANIAHMRDLIDTNTIMMAGSAPNYPNGIMDDIEALSSIAAETGVPLHIDACLGGFVAPFVDGLAPFDFRLPGVTSISMDTHKFGNGEKGSSVILYRGKELRHYQYFTNTKWMGGIYMTPTLEGSRSGIPGVLAYVAMIFHGKKGYKECAEKLIAAQKAIKEAVNKEIPELEVIGDPQLMVVAFRSKNPNINIHQVYHEMAQLGWNLNLLQNPSSFHLCITNVHTAQHNFPTNFIDALRTAVSNTSKNPNEKLTGTAAVYNAAGQYPKELVDQLSIRYLDIIYQTRPSMVSS